VPSKKTLTSTNLEALGVQRLAELLIEVSTGNAAVKQRLRLELAAAQNPGEVAKEVRKKSGNFRTIARACARPENGTSAINNARLGGTGGLIIGRLSKRSQVSQIRAAVQNQ
jgi:hypothetical protein